MKIKKIKKKILKNQKILLMNKLTYCSYNILYSKRALIKISALFIIFLNLNIFCNSFFVPSKLANIKSNCLWIESKYLLDSANVDEIIFFAQFNGINEIYLQVLDNGLAFYNSNIVCNAVDKSYNYDPLIYAINEVQGTDIKINAWLDMYKLWDDIGYPPYNNQDSLQNIPHYYYQCPECLEVDINGRSDSKINLDQYQSKNWEGIFISPIHPETNIYLFSIVKEVVDNYNIGGVYLDYVRYQDSFYGYNKSGVKLFEEEFGINPRDLKRGLISNVYGYSEEEVQNYYKLWDEYRVSKITELVHKISIYLDDKRILLNLGVQENLNNSKKRWFQDWENWVKNNLVDFVSVDSKSNNFNQFIFNNKIYEDAFLKENLEKLIINFSINEDAITIADKVFLLNPFSNQILSIKLSIIFRDSVFSLSMEFPA